MGTPSLGIPAPPDHERVQVEGPVRQPDDLLELEVGLDGLVGVRVRVGVRLRVRVGVRVRLRVNPNPDPDPNPNPRPDGTPWRRPAP